MGGALSSTPQSLRRLDPGAGHHYLLGTWYTFDAARALTFGARQSASFRALAFIAFGFTQLSGDEKIYV
ncbi:MAG: hypothetical protein HOB82_05595 [Alphaproteobacteria bacterium]|jgi:hypothetical protein|nr:hypothetical protein [Alphaproteobacteria bacterium]